MTLALLLAYEWTRMSLIKECNSIKSDHSHYPVHLVGLWLGRCCVRAHTRTHVRTRKRNKIPFHTRLCLENYSFAEKWSAHIAANTNIWHEGGTVRKTVQSQWFTCCWFGGAKTHKHIWGRFHWRRSCVASDASTWPPDKQERTHAPTHDKIHSVST